MLISLPVSVSLTHYWTLGSFLGISLVLQLISGLLLSIQYTPDVSLALSSVDYITREVWLGWLVRLLHISGASLFFILLYFHLFKAVLYGSYRLGAVWLTGWLLLLISMAIAFLGYAILWSQISYWAVVVITSLLSVIPLLGTNLVTWVWGGYSVGSSTLHLFYTLHFVLPWLLLLLVCVHLSCLHTSGSTSNIGYSGYHNKTFFFPYLVVEDIVNVVVGLLFISFVLVNPYMFSDPEAFVETDTLVSPTHIVPEWYFLWVYGVLRSFPNNLLGVLVVLVVILYPLSWCVSSGYAPLFSGLSVLLSYSLVGLWLLLGWLGQCPAETPYVAVGFTVSCCFLIMFFLLSILSLLEKSLFSCK